MVRSQPHQFRIISGRYRGRRFSIPAHSAVRPSPERVRETLFNWLMFSLPGSHCLDAFAGSGSLGLEALSRGAEQVLQLDIEPSVIRHLKTCQKILLYPPALGIEQADFLCWSTEQKFDFVFLDPPFRKNFFPACLKKTLPLLSKKGKIYVECEALLDLEKMAKEENYTVLKTYRAGQVQAALLAPVIYPNDFKTRTHSSPKSEF